MFTIELLRVFVSERLKVAAEEICGAVEKTITEYEHISRRHRLHSVLKHEDVDSPAASQEVALSEEETPSEQQHAEQWNTVLAQDIKTSSSQGTQEHWSSQEAEEPENDALNFILAPSFTKCGLASPPMQTLGNRDREPLPSTSTEHMPSAHKGDSFGNSEPISDWRLQSSESLVTEYVDGTDDLDHEDSKSAFKTVASKKRKTHPQQKTNVSCKSWDSEDLASLKSFRPGHSPFCCKVCGESFDSGSYLLKHVQAHSEDMTNLPESYVLSVENAIKHTQSQEEQNKCEICNKTFTQKSHLKRHMWVHTGHKPFCCKQCGRRFGRSENLRIHERVHTVERPFICGFCGKGFIQKCHMDAHLKNHTG